MGRATVGQLLPDLPCWTPQGTQVFLKTVVEPYPWTALLFHRFCGCLLSQYDLYCYQQQAGQFGKNLQVVFIFPSSPQQVASLAEGCPLRLLCDPEGALYRQLEILPAATLEQMISKEADAKVAQAQALGMHLGEPEGDPLQLPAILLADQKGIIQKTAYLPDSGAVPAPEQLAAWAGIEAD